MKRTIPDIQRIVGTKEFFSYLFLKARLLSSEFKSDYTWEERNEIVNQLNTYLKIAEDSICHALGEFEWKGDGGKDYLFGHPLTSESKEYKDGVDINELEEIEVSSVAYGELKLSTIIRKVLKNG